MTRRFTYEIIVKVQREGLLTLPIADFHVLGSLDPESDFGRQLEATFAASLARVQPKLTKARDE
jgi:hypothetical protein